MNDDLLNRSERDGAPDDPLDDLLGESPRITDAPGSERSVRLWRAFLSHRRAILSGALVAVLIALLAAIVAREGVFAPKPPLYFAAGVAHGAGVSASSPYARLGAAPDAALTTYHVTAPGVGLMQPAVDASGNLWVGEMLPNHLTRVNAATGEVTSWPAPNGRNNITKVAVDRAGTIWFVEQLASYIANFDPQTQGFVVYPLAGPEGGALQPQDLAFDTHGAIWFTTLGQGGAIGRLDPESGAMRLWSTRDPKTSAPRRPFSLAVTPDGEIWFGLLAGGAVGRLDPATGATTYYPLANPHTTIFAMAPDMRGHVYFTELLDGKLGEINAAARTVTERAIPQTFGAPACLYGVVVGPDGAVWFASAGANALIRYDPRRDTLTFYQLSVAGSAPFGLALDSHDGKARFWYTANGSQATFIGLLTV
jgi:streptogramin lyase